MCLKLKLNKIENSALSLRMTRRDVCDEVNETGTGQEFSNIQYIAISETNIRQWRR